MFKDVEHWCKSCQDCSMRKTPRNSKRAPLLPIPVGPFERVGSIYLVRFHRQGKITGISWFLVIISLDGWNLSLFQS